MMIPFAIYIVGFYKTDFNKSNEEGNFSSFNEKVPLEFEEQNGNLGNFESINGNLTKENID